MLELDLLGIGYIAIELLVLVVEVVGKGHGVGFDFADFGTVDKAIEKGATESRRTEGGEFALEVLGNGDQLRGVKEFTGAVVVKEQNQLFFHALALSSEIFVLTFVLNFFLEKLFYDVL